jgi:hypothetical protein
MKKHNMQASAVTPEECQRRFKSAPRLTSNVIFGAGDRTFGKHARDDTSCRQKVRLEKDAAACRKKKNKLTKFVGEYNYLKVNMLKQDCKWTIAKLIFAINCKMHPDDKPRPKGKEALLEQWGKIKRRLMPKPNQVSSDNEGSNNKHASDDDDYAVGHGVAHGVLVFGDESDSDLGGESESNVSIDEKNCISVKGV